MPAQHRFGAEMVPVNLSFPDKLLARIDAQAKLEESTRAKLVREATRKYLDQIESTSLCPSESLASSFFGGSSAAPLELAPQAIVSPRKTPDSVNTLSEQLL